MTVELTILIVITSASLITSLIGPLVTGIIEFSKRIEKSSCCGSNVELSPSQIHEEIKKTTSEHQIKMNEQNEQIDKILNFINENK